MIDLLRKCSDFVGTGHRLRWVALVVLALVVTAAEAAGAGLVFLLLALITDPNGGAELPVVGDVSELLPGVPHDQFVVAVAIGIALFFILRSALVFGQTYLQQRVVHNVGAKLATRLLRGYLALPYEAHLQRNSAEMIRNVLQSVQTVVNHVLVPGVRLVAEALVITGLLVVLVLVSPLATALAAGVLVPAILLIMRTIHPRVRRLGRESQTAIQESLQTAQQSLEGVRDVKLLGRERYFVRDFAGSRKTHAHAQYTKAALAELMPALAETILVSFIVLFFVISVLAGAGTGGTLSMLGLFAYVGLRLQPSLRKVAAAVNNIKFGMAAADDVHADLQRFTDVQLPDEDEFEFEDRIVLDHVSFSYERADAEAVKDVELIVRPGEAIGICGPTGGGKSTLVDIIAGLLKPTSGRVLVDGRDIQEKVVAWQRQLGVVSQTVFLLDSTLRENIALGVNPEEIDDTRVADAVRLAQLQEFVATLPKGLETRVGERGTRLSGGQRQRVAIARALYRKPHVLVLDEGTSALDNETEAEFISALERLRGDHTILMVAHRLSSVRRCDRILVLEDGRVTDVGTFEELAARNRLFSAFRS